MKCTYTSLNKITFFIKKGEEAVKGPLNRFSIQRFINFRRVTFLSD
jgi:hypothetical protein